MFTAHFSVPLEQPKSYIKLLLLRLADVMCACCGPVGLYRLKCKREKLCFVYQPINVSVASRSSEKRHPALQWRALCVRVRLSRTQWKGGYCLISASDSAAKLALYEHQQALLEQTFLLFSIPISKQLVWQESLRKTSYSHDQPGKFKNASA